MKSFNIYSAKTNFSRLIDEVAAGQEIVIARAGRPVARLVPVGRPKRRLGILRGKWKVPADFDYPLPKDALSSFEGG